MSQRGRAERTATRAQKDHKDPRDRRAVINRDRPSKVERMKNLRVVQALINEAAAAVLLVIHKTVHLS
jgi:hypothetical protein